MRRAILAAALLLPVVAQAQPDDFPARPISMVVGFAPGGGTDILARLLATRLGEEFGQPVAVENRTGGGGTIAMVATAHSRPDGHTVTLASVSTAVQVPLAMKAAPFDPLKDVTPIALVATVPMVVTVPATSPARDLRGFIEACVAVYRGCTREQLLAPRMRAWLDDAEVARLFDYHAADGLARNYAKA